MLLVHAFSRLRRWMAVSWPVGFLSVLWDLILWRINRLVTLHPVQWIIATVRSMASYRSGLSVYAWTAVSICRK